jgi:alpha-tubulin suppressor-like RCC1 family protein
MTKSILRAASPDRSSREWRNASAFAALTDRGEIRAWGSPASGGLLSAEADELTGVRQIYSTVSAFAALTSSGAVVAWGGNGGDTSAVADQLQGGIRSLASTTEAFAALDLNGGVTTWGTARAGGDTSDLSDVLAADVVEIYSTDHAFAARKKDGSVIGWGDEFSGGFRGKSGIDVATDVRTIRTTAGAFAALREDDTVVTWGYWNHGGEPDGQAAMALASGQVQDVFSNEFTFAAVLKDGSVVSWGVGASGGDTSQVVDQLVNVERIVGNRNAFTAITSGGQAISWGISGDNYIDVAAQLGSGVVDVIASDQAFAAIKSDGSVVTWGSDLYGANSSDVSAQLASGVVDITASKHSFAALKSNGSVVVWGGDQDQAADSSAVQGQLQSGVEKIYANDNAFAALKSDGSIVAWGNDELGGSTRFATGGTLSGIVNLAEVFTDELIGQSFADPDPVDDFLEGQLIQRVEISPADTITSEKKKGELLSGTKNQDLFLNGVGNNRFRGRKGSDIFWFDRDEKFGKRHAERILDYKPSKDVIIFGGNRFAGMSDNPEFLSVKRKADFNAAMKTESEFVYWSAKGGLYFNANGDDRGAGDGGLFALLSGKPALTVESIGFTE